MLHERRLRSIFTDWGRFDPATLEGGWAAAPTPASSLGELARRVNRPPKDASNAQTR